MLLDQILQLEATVGRQPSSPSPHSPNVRPHSQTLAPNAYPRTLRSAHVQAAFQPNLHEALDEVRTGDPLADTLYTSRHIGPQARKRQLEEMEEREEEARDARKAPRRGKAATAPNSFKAQFINNAGVPPTHQLSPGSPMSPLGSEAENHTVTDGDSSTGLPKANGNSTLDTPAQIGSISPTSLAVPAPSMPSTTVRHTKPKQLKAHTVTSKSYCIPMVPHDKNGKPILL